MSRFELSDTALLLTPAWCVYADIVISCSNVKSTTRAQLLTVPPYAAAAVCTVAVGFIADRTKQRGLCNIVMSLVGVVGFAMLLGERRLAYKRSFLLTLS